MRSSVHSPVNSTRDSTIDFLRAIGLLLIILAHTDELNPLLFQLRNFDVPLMVIVSALSFSAAYKPGRPYMPYVISRIKRLVLPVWLFLTGYFISIAIFDPASPDLLPKPIIGSFLLLGGIGYVWIIRVFVLMALIAPYVYKFHQSKFSNKGYFAYLSAVYLFYELAVYLYGLSNNTTIISMFIEDVVFYSIPYGIILAIGFRLPMLTLKNLRILTFIMVILTILFAVILYVHTGAFIPTQNYKYPPRFYYLSYALASSLLLCMFGRLFWQKISHYILINRYMTFLSVHSLWVYLWHIPFIKYYESSAAQEFIVFLTGASFITYVQHQIITRLK